jgi:hypothetical protein
LPILDQVREHVETGLVDDALLRLIDDATVEVESRFGDDSAQTEYFQPAGRRVVLKRAATSITSVDYLDSSGTSFQTLAPTDYRLRNRRIIERLAGGASYDWVTNYDNPGWGSLELRVVYVPEPEIALRDRIVIDLVRLAVQYEALAQQGVGDYNMQSLNYLNERERLLTAASHRRGLRIQ